LGDI